MNFSDLHNPAAAAKAIRDFKRRFSAKICLSPFGDCNGKIVSAHTLSAEAMLRPISRDGHVYALKLELPPKNGTQPMTLQLSGIRETSTFNGFCAKHDKDHFTDIEDKTFTCTHSQIFRLAFRAVAKESYLKRKQADDVPDLEVHRSIHGIPSDIPLTLTEEYQMHFAASLRGAEDIERLKARLDKYFITEDFGRLKSTVIEFNTPPPIAASFAYAPDYDFDGRELQDFTNMDRDLSIVCITLLPTQTGGFLILSHEDSGCEPQNHLVSSLTSQTDITSSTAWLIACQTENFAISPTWYESLSNYQREQFLAAYYANSNPMHCAFNLLQNVKLKCADWGVKNIFTL